MEKTSLKKMRLERGLTQQQVADGLGISVQAVSSWETGRYSISDLSRYKIAAFFGVDPDLVKTEVKDE